MSADDSLTPDQIESHSFASGFRGYDQTDVRDYLKRLAAQIRELRERAEELESAWHSAEERAARPPVLDEDTLMAAVGEETASILRSARAAAAEMRAKANEDAQRMVADGKTQADQIVEEAKTVLGREKMAAEEAAGRIVAAAQAEAAELLEKSQREADTTRAKADQDRMLTVEGANATRDRILEDLSRRRRVASVQIEQLRAGRERLIESYAVVRRTLEEAQTELSRADAEARAAADEVGRRMRGAPVGGELVVGGFGGESPVAAVAVVEEVAAELEVLAEAEAEPDPGQPEVAAEGGAVEELFARLRASQPPPVAEALVDAEAEAEMQAPVSDADEALLQKRESAMAELEAVLTRRLKRALQDDQNDLLDRLRGVRGTLTVERLLPGISDHVGRYAATARPLAEQAAGAGGSFAREALGQLTGKGGKGGKGEEPPAVVDLATDAGNNIVEPLRRRLEQVIRQSTEEEEAVLVEALGGAYREWKSQRIERVAGDLLAAAFSRGTWHAAPAGTPMRWIVDDADGPCPDCDDDALAGALPKGEAFPTGQQHPPAHSGCRCLLVPSP